MLMLAHPQTPHYGVGGQTPEQLVCDPPPLGGEYVKYPYRCVLLFPENGDRYARTVA